MPVYMIRSETSGLTKIGNSRNPVNRLKTLQTGSCEQLYIIRLFFGGQGDESALHKRFAEYRRIGEWFDIPDHILMQDFGLTDLKIPKDLKQIMFIGPPQFPRASNAERQANFRARKSSKEKIVLDTLESIVDMDTLGEMQAAAARALALLNA